MIRPWKTWLVFGVCFVVLLAAMGWISLTTLHLDRLQQRAAEQADLEERVRSALWRMDSWLALLIAEESARPASAYQAFAPAERAYGPNYAPLPPKEVLLPSALLSYASSNVLLHFELDPFGRLTSPQVPAPQQRGEVVANFSPAENLDENAQRLDALRVLLVRKDSGRAPAAETASSRRTGPEKDTEPISEAERLFDLTAVAGNSLVMLESPTVLTNNNDIRLFEQQQAARSKNEFDNRRNVSQFANMGSFNNFNYELLQTATPTTTAAELPGQLQPVWIGDELLLVRRVQSERGRLVQGCWLNWAAVKSALLESIRDLLPAAKLEPMRAANGSREARALAALPVRLVPGDVPTESTMFWTPVRTSLTLAWACVMFAGMAAAFLLQGTLALSERRAAFVSAVTHELRTPLTTFKLYSEMLADGMVEEKDRQRQYLATLCSEANRLNHLVENVLAYARLERGSTRGRLEQVTLIELIQRVKPRLVGRAAQAGMQIVEDVAPTVARTCVRVDVSVVEQILFNLVDNACKHAATATDKIIHLEAVPENGAFALLRVRDHGQGISAEVAKRMFQPFNKSAMEAAHGAPGVGLGLALCRRLSRSMGGELSWDAAAKPGACFNLRLPIGTAG